MAYEKRKEEEYSNIGGINGKASVYVTGEREVLDLVNYDLSTPGAWTKRWGMTSALVAGNTVTVGASNRLNFGAQAIISAFGTSVFYGNSAVFGMSTWQGQQILTRNVLIGNSQPYTYDDSAHVLGSIVNTGSTHSQISTNGIGNAVSIYSSGKSVIYISAQGTMYKYDPFFGSYYYGLPRPNLNNTQTSVGISAVGSGGLSGGYNFNFSWMDQLGYVGAANTYLGSISFTGTFTGVRIDGFTMMQQDIQSAAAFLVVYSDRLATSPGVMSPLKVFPAVSGITSIIIKQSDFAGTQIVQTPTTQPLPLTIDAQNELVNFDTQSNSNYGFPDPRPQKVLTSRGDCVEYWNGRLWIGCNQGYNYILFSDVIENQEDAQTIFPQNILTLQNQNFPLIALKGYNQTLIALYQKGLTRITGDQAPFTNYDLSEEFGVVNSRAVVGWKERLWFLDENHILEFNGANISVVSDRVDHIIARMNVSVAQKTATAYYYQEKNEVWFAIPIDGATENNIILIYDTLAQGWTTTKSQYNFTMVQEFYTPSLTTSLSMNNKKVYTSSPGGSLVYFGASFSQDDTLGFTLSFKTRYHVDQKSSTMEWRRMYLDTGPWIGSTLSFKTNFYANFATSTISYTTTIFAAGSPYSGPQQTRIDFGIPAKSLSTEVFESSTLPVRVYGYTFENRFLRKV